MHAFVTIAGLDFNVFIRGLLVVAVGVAVLMGSIFLILSTNSGFRTGLFLAFTGLFGWMFIMGIVWTIYGIGYQGRLASWKVIEMNRGDLTGANFGEAAQLGNSLVTIEEQADTAAEGLEELFAAAEESQDPPKLAGWEGMLASNRARGEARPRSTPSSSVPRSSPSAPTSPSPPSRSAASRSARTRNATLASSTPTGAAARAGPGIGSRSPSRRATRPTTPPSWCRPPRLRP